MNTARQEASFQRKRPLGTISDIRSRLHLRQDFHGMVGESSSMKEIFKTIELVGKSDFPVLIVGETGTGKELTAQAVHNESDREKGPFVPINCGALPESIVESELFGHVRGAFTGAITDRKGRFELASRGTLFLDEVNELPAAVQVKLLRVLQDKCFERVGGEETLRSDVRIVSATNADLREQVENGTFREDLFYRLCVVPIALPPLRERTGDVPIIAHRVLESIRKETGKQIRFIGAEAMTILEESVWPGNIRQLINALQYASLFCEGDKILPRHLPFEMLVMGSRKKLSQTSAEDEERSSRHRVNLTCADVVGAIHRSNGNKSKAARVLRVGRATLYRFIKDNNMKL